MTDNEIIKALECCAVHGLLKCEKCPKKNEGVTCMYALSKDALDLIKRQKAEIEKLNVELVGMRGACESYKMHYDNAQAEIERLQNAYKQCAWERDTFLEQLETAKSEAIKEFAERLKEQFSENKYILPSVNISVDNLVKEMTEQ